MNCATSYCNGGIRLHCGEDHDNKVDVQFAQVKKQPEADGGEGTVALLKLHAY